MQEDKVVTTMTKNIKKDKINRVAAIQETTIFTSDVAEDQRKKVYEEKTETANNVKIHVAT